MNISEILKQEEDEFFKRYCQQEIVTYENVTLIGSLKALFKKHVLFRKNNKTKDNNDNNNNNNNNDDDDDVYLLENFWDAFLRENTSLVSLIHAINIILLIVTTYYTALLPYYKYSLMFDCLVWIIVSLLCLFSIILYKISIWRLKAKKLWTKIGYLIFYLRGLHLLSKIVKTLIATIENSNLSYAFDGYQGITDDDKVFFDKIVMGATAVDLSQLVVFSTVPFPSPINFYFCIEELILQIIRLILNPHTIVTLENIDKYIFYAKLVTIVLSHFMVLLSVVGVEFMAKKRYKNLALAKLAIADKNRFINLICSDTKAIVSDLTIGIKNIAEQSSGTDMSIHINKLLKHAQRINLVADNLSVLIKLEDEIRKPKESIVDIQFLVEKVQMDPCFLDFKVELKVDFTNNIDQYILIDADKLYMLLRNGLYCCFDKMTLLHDFESISIELSCKLEKIKDSSKCMLVFTISNSSKMSKNYSKNMFKTKRSFSHSFEVAESKIVALMSLSSYLDGYCEVNDDVNGVNIECGVSCRIVSPIIREDIQKPLMTLVSDDDIDQRSSLTKRIVKNSKINNICVSIVTKDYVKFQMMIKILRHVGIKADKVTNLKSLEKLSTPSKYSFDTESHLVADLLLVDSVEGLHQLSKYSKYSGLVVFVNDETNNSTKYDYMENANQYQIPLHYIHTDIIKFDQWLSSKLCRPRQSDSIYKWLRSGDFGNFDSKGDQLIGIPLTGTQALSSSTSSTGDTYTNRLNFKSSNKSLGVAYFRKFISHRKFDFTQSVWGLSTLTFKYPAVEESYLKTRLLNPTKCWIHPGSAVVWTSYSYFFQEFVIHSLSWYFTSSIAWRYRQIFNILAVLMIYFKDALFEVLNSKLGLTCRLYCASWFLAVFICWNIMPAMLMYGVVLDGKFIYKNPYTVPHRTIDRFMDYHYNGYNGKEYLDAVFIYIVFLIGTYGLGFLCWPYSLMFPLTNFTLLSLFMNFVCKLINHQDDDFQAVVKVILTTLISLVMVSLVHFEWMNRTNFQLLRKTIYTNDFIAECYRLCHHDVVNPLKTITKYHKELLSLLLEDILSKRVTLNLSMKRSIDSMNIQFLLLELLLLDSHKGFLGSSNSRTQTHNKIVPSTCESSYTTEHKDNYFVDVYSSEAMGIENDLEDMNENVYLKSEVQQLSEALSAYYNQDNFYIKIYVEVDETLSIIRANKKLIRVLIAVAILNSIEIIQQNNYQSKSSAESFNEIVITVTPRSSNNILPFTSRRWMNVTVRCTGSAADSKSSSSEKSTNFVQYKCNEIRDLIRKLYISETTLEKSIDQKHRNSIFNLELPYKLQNEHEQMLSICNKKVKSKLKIIENSSLFERYEQWRRSKQVSTKTRTYSVLIIQYIPDADNTLLMKLLQGAGWDVELVSSIRVVEFNPGYLNCDCIIIDYSRCDNSKKLSRSQFDEVEIIKFFGYKGLLVGLFDNYSSLNKGILKIYKRQFHLMISHPIIDNVIDTIASAIIAHEIRLLLFFSSYAS